jgi:hypothetical protein
MRLYFDTLLDRILEVGWSREFCRAGGYHRTAVSVVRRSREVAQYISVRADETRSKTEILATAHAGVCYLPLNRLRAWPDVPGSAFRCHIWRRVEEFLPGSGPRSWRIGNEHDAKIAADEISALLDECVLPKLDGLWTIEGLIEAWSQDVDKVVHPVFETDRARWLEQLRQLLLLAPHLRLVKPPPDLPKRGAKHYLEGDWILVPFDDRPGYALGLVARVSPTCSVMMGGFFFGPSVDSPPTAERLRTLRPSDALTAEIFGNAGLLYCGWPIIWHSPNWGVERELWRLPDFGRIDVVDWSIGYRTTYHPDDPAVCIRELRCSAEEARTLPNDGIGWLPLSLRLALFPETWHPDPRNPPIW